MQWHKINNARGRNAAGFCDFSRVEHVERVEGWETVFALGPLRPLRGSRFALRQPDACRRGRMARDHETLPACRAAFRRLKGRGSTLARRSLRCLIL